MCQSCGCTPCVLCGQEIEDGVCSGCGEIPTECVCGPDVTIEEEFKLETDDEEEED